VTKRSDLWSTVWITGASSGIGRAIAIALAQSGRRICISGRTTQRLEEVAKKCREKGSDVEIVPFDIGVESDRAGAIDTLRSRGINPDLLINNAGVSQRDEAVSTEFSIDRKIMEINYLGAVHLTKAFLPGMIDRGTGTVAVVSSIAGIVPSRMRSSYNAAKAAQIAFFRTLRNETASRGVTISIVIPGFVRTEVSENAFRGDGMRHGQLDANLAKGIDPDRAARTIVGGLARRKRVIYTGVPIGVRAFMGVGRVAPGIVDRVLQKVTVQ
jgi:dehydrogenase/reductase SDR family protein 7B